MLVFVINVNFLNGIFVSVNIEILPTLSFRFVTYVLKTSDINNLLANISKIFTIFDPNHAHRMMDIDE